MELIFAPVLKAAGMETIEVYMERRRNTNRNYAVTSAVYGRRIRSTAMSTNVNKVVWWKIKDSQNDMDDNLLITKIDDHQNFPFLSFHS